MRSRASTSSPTRRAACSRRCSTVFDATRPISSGWLSTSVTSPRNVARRERSWVSSSTDASVRRNRASAWAGVPRWAASWRTDSSPRPSRRRAAPSKSPASATRPATACSVAAPTSRRWHVLRATTMGDVPCSRPVTSAIRAARSTRSHDSPAGFGCRVAHPGQRAPVEGGERVDVGLPSSLGGRTQLGQGPLDDAGDHQQPPRPGRSLLQELEEERSIRTGPAERPAGQLREPVHDRGAGDRLAAPDGDLEGDLQHPSGRWLGDQLDLVVDLGQPALGRPGAAGGGVRLAALAQLEQPLAEEGRRGQRGDKDDEQQRGVDVLAEDALAEPQGGEDQAHLAAGDHADAHQQPVARRAQHAGGRRQLADDRNDEERARHAQHVRVGELRDVGVDADLQEEHGDEDVTDRAHLPLDALRRAAAGQDQPGHEGTDDGCQLGLVGQDGETEGEGHGDPHEGAARPAVPGHGGEQRRHEPQAEGRRDDQEADGDDDDPQDAEDGDRPLGHDPGDDGQDDQAHHVVGDGRPQDRPRLDRGERPQVAEDPAP